MNRCRVLAEQFLDISSEFLAFPGIDEWVDPSVHSPYAVHNADSCYSCMSWEVIKCYGYKDYLKIAGDIDNQHTQHNLCDLKVRSCSWAWFINTGSCNAASLLPSDKSDFDVNPNSGRDKDQEWSTVDPL